MNPGPTAIAAVASITDDGWTGTQTDTKFIGRATNNVGEYQGLIMALNLAERMFGERINQGDILEIRSDSRLVVEQVLGNWRVRDKHGKLWDLHAQAQKIALRLKSRGIDVQIKHIPRAENQVADRIVTDLLDERLEKKRGY